MPRSRRRWRADARSIARRSTRCPRAAAPRGASAAARRTARTAPAAAWPPPIRLALIVSKSALRSCSRSVHDSAASISMRCGPAVAAADGTVPLNSASASRRFSGGRAVSAFCFICGISSCMILPSRSGSFQKMWKAWSNSVRCSPRLRKQADSTAVEVRTRRDAAGAQRLVGEQDAVGADRQAGIAQHAREVQDVVGEPSGQARHLR